jgi:hypothetical protein
MKKLLLVLLLAILSTTAIADGYHNRNYHGHGGSDNVLLPLIVGGTIGYIIAQPRTVIVQQPQYAPLPSYVPANEPIYQYQNIYDGNCACYRQILVQIN